MSEVLEIERGKEKLEKDLINLTIEICKVGPDGKAVPHRLIKTNSWTKQAAQIFQCRFSRQNVSNVKDTGGTLRTITATSAYRCLLVQAAAADYSYGIQVGTSTTTPTRDDYKLGTQILHGTGSGQLEHKAMVINTPIAVTSPDGYRLSLSRQFDNNSGGQITVEEMGLAVYRGGGTSYVFLVLHDLINEAIPNGESRIFKYQLDFIA